MGKKIVVVALLLLIIAAALVEYSYVKGASQRLTEALQQVQSALTTDDSAAAQAAARDFCAQWEDEKKRLEALYEHDEVDVISATAKRIETFCNENDRVNALAEVSSGLFYVSHLREMISLRWENIL
jgi:hypothetical protein